MVAKPFLKWAGGKGQLLPIINEKYPDDLATGRYQYCEPFVGGGAVLFDVLSKYPFQSVLINDINTELINTYKLVKSEVEELINQLDKLQSMFWPMNDELRKQMYYEKRDRYNLISVGSSASIDLEKAALLIFLNKTCFNGLYRVNSQGQFNVPMGSYKMPMICDAPNLRRVSNLLKNVNIVNSDFRNCLPFITKNTFVYIDPPYRPLSVTASFNSYAKADFDDNEQIELGRFVDTIHLRGAKIVISNSDPKNINEEDDFFDALYNRYDIIRIPAKRMINSNAELRGDINELLISNF